MKRTLVGLSVALLVGGSAALAQAPAAAKPGPEHKTINYFVGKWTSEGEMKKSSLGPGGKTTGSDTCELFSGGFNVVCRGTGTGPMGNMSSLGILGYSASDKAYTYYGIDSMGMNELSHGQKSGTTWTFDASSNVGGQSFKSRYTIVELSPTSYSFKWDMSSDGTQWNNVMEGKATKAPKGT